LHFHEPFRVVRALDVYPQRNWQSALSALITMLVSNCDEAVELFVPSVHENVLVAMTVEGHLDG
jgi:hypothetical protein